MLLEILKSPEFGALVSNLVIALIGITIPFVANAIRGFVNAHAKDTRFQLLLDIARTAVMAAEQAGLNGLVEDKKEYALNLVQNMLKEKGLQVDVSAIDAAIESAVATELNGRVIDQLSYEKSQSVATAPTTPDADGGA
jgi:hypothetical protein